jgi:CIC family chloride channel protein
VADSRLPVIERPRRFLAPRWRLFVAWFHSLELSENTILMAFAVAVGGASALGVVAFYELIDLAYTVFFGWPAEHLSRDVFLAYRPVVTAAGLFAAWWVMRHLGRGHDGLNVPDVQLAVARRSGVIPTRPALARTAASAITLGAGGSAGSEGPVAVLGATVGSFLGRSFRFEASRINVLVAAGAAGGISAAFNAPLAGAFFALEEILGNFAVGAFPAVIVSSVVAAVVSRGVFGNHPAFPIPTEYGYSHVAEMLVFFPLLGVLAGLAGGMFVRLYFRADDAARGARLRPWALPLAGGALVGLLVYSSDGLLGGDGHLAFRLDVFGRLPFLALALLAVGKMLATSITLNTGGSGGVFTPSLYVGAATGGAFGVGIASLFPGLGLTPEAYALVGMGAVVAAATDAPLTGILIVFEMTNDYAIVLPLMLATVIATIVAKRIERDSLYSGWLRRRGEVIEHGASRDVMAGLRVADVYDRNPQIIDQHATVAELLAVLGRGEQTEFPVVDTEERLVGIITVAQLGQIALEQADLAGVLVAADIALPSETLSPADSLLDAVRRLGVRGSASVPVVDPKTGRLIGILGRSHVLGVYERAQAQAHVHAQA